MVLTLLKKADVSWEAIVKELQEKDFVTKVAEVETFVIKQNSLDKLQEYVDNCHESNDQIDKYVAAKAFHEWLILIKEYSV